MHCFVRPILAIHQSYKVTFYILKYFKSLIFGVHEQTNKQTI